MSVVLSLANADLALRRTSITLPARRCKAEERRSPDDERHAGRWGPDRGLAQPDHPILVLRLEEAHCEPRRRAAERARPRELISSVAS